MDLCKKPRGSPFDENIFILQLNIFVHFFNKYSLEMQNKINFQIRHIKFLNKKFNEYASILLKQNFEKVIKSFLNGCFFSMKLSTQHFFTER